MEDEIRVVELFAGVGGFRLGLDRASPRFHTIWANQWEPGRKTQFAFDCYSSHFSHTDTILSNEDIGIAKSEVPDHDLLVGGFPCQDYSVASTNAKGIEGKKGVLWWHIHDIILAKNPKYVLLENVDRLVKSPTTQRGRDFGIILRCLADAGYNAEWRIINAAEYGLQQRRRRIFIFAYKAKDSEKIEDGEKIISKTGFFAEPFPISKTIIEKKMTGFSIDSSKYKTLVDFSNEFEHTFYKAGVMIGHNIYSRDVVPIESEKQITLRSLLETDVDEKYYVSDLTKWETMKGPKKIQRVDKKGYEYTYSEGGIPFPEILDRPGRTMLTSEGTPNRSSHLIEDPQTKKLRILTPVECERLNGFDDNWTNTGMSERQRYFTMGNALVVQLIEKMGKRILEL